MEQAELQFLVTCQHQLLSDGTAVAHLGLLRVWYSCQGGDGGDSYARLDEEDDDGDIPIIGLTGAGYWDFREFGGIPADKSNNTNESDVNFVVPGSADDGNMYTVVACLLYTSPSPRDGLLSRMPSSA